MITWFEEVKSIWGKCTRKQAETLLWNCTAFPCCSTKMVFEQLKQIKEKSGGNFNKALEIVEKELDQALKATK